ncbi:hypothetical protein BP6252_11895 [Coleophoma cylindrospora]|uniref:N-terminal of MaoC-like dehydratase domain-containing protein n=1 Tax=Coleophoma cylindrospora TaxID=1849047 RepID=A0A3D8QKY7_9HELO|nr:hypothetical protein BP6252_11895 [Coleophoma cylindrospora]
MSFQIRRLLSASTRNIGNTSSQIASEFLTRVQYNGPLSSSQLLDGNQLQRLSQTLNRANLSPDQPFLTQAPPNGTPVPAGYHLAYFTPSALESGLGSDGSDRLVNPKAPFTRRMWAGGEITWMPGNLLKVGDIVTESTKFLSAVPKKTRLGEEMIIVGLEKSFENDQGLALVDRRDWVFRPEITDTVSLSHAGAAVPFPEGSHIRDFIHTPVSLFRFSALTFNAHKIHYSLPWCREVEGHRNLVVHGPLNLIQILDLWRDTRPKGSFAFPKSIKYRASSPVYAEEPYRIVLKDNGDGQHDVKIWTREGKVGMTATIQAF